MFENLVLSLAISAHLGITGDWNSLHPRISYNHNNFITGVYYNSESQLSTYAGMIYDINESVKIEYGLVTGYSQYQLVPMIKVNYENFFVAPAKAHNQFGAVVGIEVKF